MRDWLSAADLSALALPGLPGTPAGWHRYAEREGWLDLASGRPGAERSANKVRLRTGRGGGLEFHVDLLPPAALAAYVAKHVGAVALDDASQAEAAQEGRDEQLALPALENRDARLALLMAADRLARDANLSRNVADRLFVAEYRLGRIEVASWVRQACPSFSERSLARWRMLKSREGIARLGVDKGAARRGKGVLQTAEGGAVKRAIRALMAMNSHFSADHIKTKIEHDFPALKGAFHVRSLQRLMGRIERDEAVLLLQLRNPDAARSRHRMTGGTNAPVSRLNELWQIDASPADVLLVDGRHSIYVCIDIYSRRVIVYVTRTPRAEAVALLNRRAILSWGKPERVKTDNGSDFKAKFVARLFAALEIEVEVSAPYQPQQKGHVERVIRTFQHDCTPLLPGFVGHNVADRKAIEERRAFAQRLGQDDAGAFKVELTATELQSICDDWAEHRYANRIHSAIKCTPNEMAARYSGTVHRIADPLALNLLMAPVAGGDGMRTVSKRGVRIDHSFYLTPVLPETRVFVRMDPADMGRCWLFSEDGEKFLGEGVCPELAGVNPVAALAEAKKQRAAIMDEKFAEARADMRKVKKNSRDMIDAVIRNAARDAGKLVDFPKVQGLKREERYTTPGLEAAGEAAGGEARVIVQPEPAISHFVEPEPEVVQLPETAQQRFRRARDLEARLANNERVGDDEAIWLGGYRQSHEYRALKEIHDDGEETSAVR